MTVLSVLRASVAPTTRAVLAQTTALPATRSMGHARIMNITPSRFQWHKFKDMLHLYVVGAAVPLLFGVFLVNVFVGPAQLTELPDAEERVPAEHEYQRSPITRFMVRYLMQNKQADYEKKMHFLYETYHKRDLRMIEDKVREVMMERGDYKAWYYVPYIMNKYRRIVRKSTEEVYEHRPASSFRP